MLDEKHTASLILDTFLLSKRSTKKIFGLNLARIGLLNYLCASMDAAFKKTKKLVTKLYESQICRHCHCDPKTLRLNRAILIKKKMIKFDAKKRQYSLGQILTLWGVSPYRQEVGSFSLLPRSRESLPISNSSNSTNKVTFENDNQKHEKKPEKMSKLLEDFMKAKGQLQ
jgi:hypothetical protein